MMVQKHTCGLGAVEKLQLMNEPEMPQNCVCNRLFKNVYTYVGVERGHTAIF